MCVLLPESLSLQVLHCYVNNSICNLSVFTRSRTFKMISSAVYQCFQRLGFVSEKFFSLLHKAVNIAFTAVVHIKGDEAQSWSRFCSFFSIFPKEIELYSVFDLNCVGILNRFKTSINSIQTKCNDFTYLKPTSKLFFKNLKNLEIHISSLCSNDVALLTQYLGHCERLTTLNFHLTSCPQHFSRILAKLSRLPSLICLNLDSIGIQPEIIPDMSNLLKSSRLSELNLSHNNLNLCRLDTIWNALKDNSALRSLNFCGNHLGDSVALLGEAMRHNKSIVHLNLESNSINSSVVLKFLEFLIINQKLEILNLSNNDIRDDGSQHFFNYLSSNPLLQKLILTGNQISNTGYGQILKSLYHNVNLNYLDYSTNQISSFKPLTQFLKCRSASSLNQIILDDNDFSLIEIVSFAGEFFTLTHFLGIELELWPHRIDDLSKSVIFDGLNDCDLLAIVDRLHLLEPINSLTLTNIKIFFSVEPFYRLLNSSQNLKIISDSMDVDGTVVNLNLADREIDSLELLEYFKNLKFLDLSGSSVSDYSGLKYLKQLEELDLNSSNIVDVSTLQSLTSLRVLNLSGTSVDDVSDLKNLHNLRYLNLSYSCVEDVSPLCGIQDLIIDHSSLSDIEEY
ncbi:hypothetical protein GEMRC1_005272 [Eukaryota sp. GEM-RC1]